MKNTRVYDWPTRIIHWLFAASFLGAFFIAKSFDDESAYFPYHMLLGFILVMAVGLRFIWGFIGSKYARFSSFPLSPTKFIAYFKNLLSGKGERFLGHNPASSWAALLMMTLAIGLGATGYLMATGISKEFYEELHELFANLFLVTVIVHVAGIALHTLVHRDSISLSMIHGGKQPVNGTPGISTSRWGAGLLFLAIVGGFVFHLNKNYDPNHQTLNLLGTTLQLGETDDQERGAKEHRGSNHGREDGRDGDDD